MAQEVIKVITRQYIPVDNTCLFDGVGESGRSFEGLSEEVGSRLHGSSTSVTGECWARSWVFSVGLMHCQEFAAQKIPPSKSMG